MALVYFRLSYRTGIIDEFMFINFSCVWNTAITVLTITSDCQYIILLASDCKMALFIQDCAKEENAFENKITRTRERKPCNNDGRRLVKVMILFDSCHMTT